MPIFYKYIITLAASSGKRNVTAWRPSVCPVGIHCILTVTHQGAACDATSVHFVQTIRMTDILVICRILGNGVYKQFIGFVGHIDYG